MCPLNGHKDTLCCIYLTEHLPVINLCLNSLRKVEMCQTLWCGKKAIVLKSISFTDYNCSLESHTHTSMWEHVVSEPWMHHITMKTTQIKRVIIWELMGRTWHVVSSFNTYRRVTGSETFNVYYRICRPRVPVRSNTICGSICAHLVHFTSKHPYFMSMAYCSWSLISMQLQWMGTGAFKLNKKKKRMQKQHKVLEISIWLVHCILQ